MYQSLIVQQNINDYKNRNIVTHWQNSIEILRILKGSMSCLIQGNVLTVEKGDICIINHNILHRIYCENDNDCLFEYMLINPDTLNTDKSIYDNYINPFINDNELSHIILKKGNPFTTEINTLMDSIIEIEKNKTDGYELILIGFLHIIFHKLYTIYKNQKEKNSQLINSSLNDILLYRKMAEFIYSNYNKTITLNDIASCANINRNKCCLLFKKYAQSSPIIFLNSYRLEKSTQLLESSDETISNIATMCGFEQASYYNRLFMKKYSITPKEYRKINQHK